MICTLAVTIRYILLVTHIYQNICCGAVVWTTILKTVIECNRILLLQLTKSFSLKKIQYLNDMQPYQFGGDMIKNVTFEESIFADAPQRFEAGTTHIAGVIGLGAAIDFVQQLDRKAVTNLLKKITDEVTHKMLSINGLQIIGQAERKSSIISFALRNIHPHDVATFLGADHIAIRAGHHCTQPVMNFYNLPATTRASFSIYNRLEEVDLLGEKIKEIQQFFA